MLGQRSPVKPLALEPPRVGLLASVGAPTVDAPIPDPAGGTRPVRWENGFWFEPEGCGESGIRNPASQDEKIIEAGQPPIQAEPFQLWAGDRCTLMDGLGREWQRRAQDQLAASESYQIAHELWTGDLTADALDCNDEPWPNAYLADPTAVDRLTNGGADPVDGLACLEAGLAHYLKGRRGMIHATPQLATHWFAASALRREGRLLLTALDTIVVPDAGYPGDGPDAPAGATQWAYGTDMVQVRLGTVVLLPDGDDLAAALDRQNNDVEYRAERMAAVTWGGCAHVGAEFDVPVCLIGGSS